MAEINYGNAVAGWSSTFEMSMKAPLLKDRIFELKSEAKAYIDNVDGSAVAGLILSVISDSDSNNNGVYQVVPTLTIPKYPNGLKLKKLDNDVTITTDDLRKSIVNSIGTDEGLEVRLATHTGTNKADLSDATNYPTYITHENVYKRKADGTLYTGVYDESGEIEAKNAAVNASGLDVVEKDDRLISKDLHGDYNEGLKVKLVHRVTPKDSEAGFTRDDWRSENGSTNYNISGLEIHANTIVENKNHTRHGESKGLAVKAGSGIKVDKDGVSTNGRLIAVGSNTEDVITPNTSDHGDEPITGDTPIFTILDRLFNKVYDVEFGYPEWDPTLKPMGELDGNGAQIDDLENYAKKLDTHFHHTYMIELGQFTSGNIRGKYIDGKFMCDTRAPFTWLDSTADVYQLHGDGFVWSKTEPYGTFVKVTRDSDGATIGDNDFDGVNIFNTSATYTPIDNAGDSCYADLSFKGTWLREDDYVFDWNTKLQRPIRWDEQVPVDVTHPQNNSPKNLRSDKHPSSKTLDNWPNYIETENGIFEFRVSKAIYWWFESPCTDHNHNFITSDSELSLKLKSINDLGPNRWSNKSFWKLGQWSGDANTDPGYHVPSTLGTTENPNCVIAVPHGMQLRNCIGPLGNYLSGNELNGIAYKQPLDNFCWHNTEVDIYYDIWCTYINSPVNNKKLRFDY